MNDFTCIPDSFRITTEVLVDFKSKSNITIYDNHSNLVVLFNLKHSMCQFGTLNCYDGVNFTYTFLSYAAIKESNDGILFYNSPMEVWTFFDDPVQKSYSEYLLERELK